MEPSSAQYQTLRDCLARRIIARSGAADSSDATSDLEDFTNYLAAELWPVLPSSLQEATYETRTEVPDVDVMPLDAISATFTDTLVSYWLAADLDGVVDFARKVLEDYAKEVCAPPPVWSSTRTSECEICEREVPLTYHHLIPRSTHAKALKKKWHPESQLNSVAWLCRPCHTAVHHVAPNEVLAREFYTVDLLLAREDIQKWRHYACKQRWGSKIHRK